MTKNKISDLNDHLFAQLERLGEEGLEGDKLQAEVTRSEAMVRVADKLLQSGALTLKAMQLHAEHVGGVPRNTFLQIEDKATPATANGKAAQ